VRGREDRAACDVSLLATELRESADQSGTDAEIIKELLGHADLRMTLRTYAHLLNRTVAKAVRKKLSSFGLKPSKVIKFRV
jgi:integrase